MNKLFYALLVFAALTCACQEIDGVDTRGMQASIVFDEFDLTVELENRNARFRMDGVVDDLDAHQQQIVNEFQLSNVQFSYSNPATSARTMIWRDGDGIMWVISFGLDHFDQRIAYARLAHEKYHALERIDPVAVELVHAVIESRGYRVNWDEYQEELRATIVEVASLEAQGLQLAQLGGSDLVVQALDILDSGLDVRP